MRTIIREWAFTCLGKTYTVTIWGYPSLEVPKKKKKIKARKKYEFYVIMK
jgi:hypothetical protein